MPEKELADEMMSACMEAAEATKKRHQAEVPQMESFKPKLTELNATFEQALKEPMKDLGFLINCELRDEEFGIRVRGMNLTFYTSLGFFQIMFFDQDFWKRMVRRMIDHEGVHFQQFKRKHIDWRRTHSPTPATPYGTREEQRRYYARKNEIMAYALSLIELATQEYGADKAEILSVLRSNDPKQDWADYYRTYLEMFKNEPEVINQFRRYAVMYLDQMTGKTNVPEPVVCR